MKDEKRQDGRGEEAERPQELPEREAHKLNHGDKLEELIPRGGQAAERSTGSPGDDRGTR